jgi:hypothetical protein
VQAAMAMIELEIRIEEHLMLATHTMFQLRVLMISNVGSDRQTTDWVVLRRFRQFACMDNEIKAMGVPTSAQLPDAAVTGRFNETFLAWRKTNLQVGRWLCPHRWAQRSNLPQLYLRTLLREFCTPINHRTPLPLLSFLEVDDLWRAAFVGAHPAVALYVRARSAWRCCLLFPRSAAL